MVMMWTLVITLNFSLRNQTSLSFPELILEILYKIWMYGKNEKTFKKFYLLKCFL